MQALWVDSEICHEVSSQCHRLPGSRWRGLQGDDGRSACRHGRNQTSRILDQTEAVLAEVGLDLDDIAKVTVFLTSLDDLEEFDAVYYDRLIPPMPARSVACVKELPFGALVQMDAVACR